MKTILFIVAISLIISGCGTQTPTQTPNTATVYIPPIQCMTCGSGQSSSTTSKIVVQ